MREAFDKHLACGIFAHGFARARGHDFLVVFSFKGRCVCPSCTTRRMAEAAAHLTEHLFPRLEVRQWVLSVPKRLRHFMPHDGVVLSIFLRVVKQTPQTNSAGGVIHGALVASECQPATVARPPRNLGPGHEGELR